MSRASKSNKAQGKPSVFFSHSPLDKPFMLAFKALFESRTSGVMDVFLSCDGESIPLGHNWVPEMEAALRDCRLMFVFLSPSSVTSKWLYFEAGFAAARGIKVVPIAILGMDLDAERPPLTLYQGFNLRSAGSLGSVMIAVNQTLGTSFKTEFSSTEYLGLEASVATSQRSAFGEHAVSIRSLIVIAQPGLGSVPDLLTAQEAVHEALKRASMDWQNMAGSRPSIRAFGMEVIFLYSNAASVDRISIELEPLLLRQTLPVAEQILVSLFGGYRDVTISMEFWPEIGVVDTSHPGLSARLFGTEVELVRDGQSLRFRNLLFTVLRNSPFRSPGSVRTVSVKLTPTTGTLATDDVAALVTVLFERQVLFAE